ncbi:hypothetical protein Trydic_g18376 [Trypoxylus dichotomus]
MSVQKRRNKFFDDSEILETLRRARLNYVETKDKAKLTRKEDIKSSWQQQKEEYFQQHGCKLLDTARMISIRKLASKKRNVKKMTPLYFEPVLNTLREGTMACGKYFTTSKRTPITRHDGPAPGAHFPDIFKDSSVIKKSFSKTPTFEWGGFRNRLKCKLDESWKPSCTLYNVDKINCLDDILKKRVSIKGPYNLFTGPRDETTIKNHFASKIAPRALDRFYTPTTAGLDYLLHHHSKKQCGVIYKEPHIHWRYLRRKAKVETPGPATYNITSHMIKLPPPAKAPFNIQAYRHDYADTDAPGPGRYFLTEPETRKRGVQEVEPRHFREFRGSKDTVVATSRLMKLKTMALRDIAKPSNFPTNINTRSRKLMQKLSKKHVEEKERRSEMREESATVVFKETGGNLQNDGHVLPSIIKKTLHQQPDLKLVKGLPSESNDKQPFALIELKNNCRTTEKELLRCINKQCELTTSTGLKIVKKSN